MNPNMDISMKSKSKPKPIRQAGGQQKSKELNCFIPNLAGIPSRQAEAEDLRLALTQWKQASRKKPVARHTQSASYWQQISACTAL